MRLQDFPVRWGFLLGFALLWNAAFYLDRSIFGEDTRIFPGPFAFVAVLGMAVLCLLAVKRGGWAETLVLRSGQTANRFRVWFYGFSVFFLVFGALALFRWFGVFPFRS
jgi:hypothetical protein